MKKPLLCLLAAALMIGCGPSDAVLKQYVMNSPRNRIALMAFSTEPGQRDVRQVAEVTLGNRLSGLGFAVIQDSGGNPADTVFGPSSEAPRMEDLAAYGMACKTPIVLVGRVERAREGKAGAPAVYRHVSRTRKDATGRRVTYDEDVISKPEHRGDGPQLRIKLKLFNTDGGRLMWESAWDPIPPEWTLDEAVRFEMERQATSLAEVYAAKKY